MALGLGYYSCEVLPEELARVAVHKGGCSSLVRASDTSMATALLSGQSPVTSTIHVTTPEGGRGMKVQTNVKAGVVINLSIAITQNVTVNQSTTVTVTVSEVPNM
jgi:hypothetical protein